jgi:V-type H+-transporting ATPase subunit a
VFRKFAKGLFYLNAFKLINEIFSFRANIYPCPENPHERRELAMGVMTRLEDLTVVLSQTQDHRSRVLAATSRNLRTWQIKVKKIKAIYHTMNMFNNDVARKCLIAECWAPVSELDRIQLALRKGSVSYFFVIN